MGKIVKAIDGMPVIDAKRPVTLHITRADIQHSDPKRPERCAAALAIKRDLHAIEARVHLSRIYIRSNKGNWQRYLTPTALKSEIVAFDRGGQFEPSEFVLKPAHPSQRLGVYRARGPHKTVGKKRRKPHVTRNVRLGPA